MWAHIEHIILVWGNTRIQNIIHPKEKNYSECIVISEKKVTNISAFLFQGLLKFDHAAGINYHWSILVWTQHTSGHVRVWRKTMPGSVLLECHSFYFLISFELWFQIFNAIGHVLFQFSKFLCSVLYIYFQWLLSWLLHTWKRRSSVTNFWDWKITCRHFDWMLQHHQGKSEEV